MNSLHKRIDRLENQSSENAFEGFAVVIEETREQVEHPERFRKVLITEASSDKFVMYKLERKDESESTH